GHRAAGKGWGIDGARGASLGCKRLQWSIDTRGDFRPMAGWTQTPLTRRAALGLSAGLFAGSRAFSVFSPSAQALAARADTEDEFELILQRYSELMAGPPDADTSHPQLQEALAAMSGRTEELLTLIEPGPDRDRVFDDLPLVDLDYTSEIQSTALQLSELAQSWAAPGS